MEPATPLKTKYAKPLHIQQLELALEMGPFMKFAQSMLSRTLSTDEDSEYDEIPTKGLKNSTDDETTARERAQRRRLAMLGTKEERQRVKMRIYNLHDLTSDREWLYELLMSDTDTETEYSDEDDYVKDMLRMHMRQQKYRENFYKKATNTQYAYYGAGMLSNTDMYPDHQQSVVGIRKRKRRTKKEKPPKLPKPEKPPKIRKRKQKLEEKPEDGEIHPSDLKHYAFGDTVAVGGDDEDELTDEAESGVDVVGGSATGSSIGLPPSQGSTRGRRRKSQQQRTPEMMAARRRRVWQLMAKKEIGRCQRARFNNHKEALQNCKRVATMCQKVVRQRAMVSQKVMKETVWRAKRLTREMLSYWKRYERVERDTRRRMEREAEEQRKMDVEIIEAKRQQRKLNFLITQTELYAHFMSKKLGQGTEEEQLRILNQLDEEMNPRLAVYDDYNPEHMKLLAVQNAEIAFDVDSAKVKQFKAQTEEIGGMVEVKEQPGIDGPKAKADLPQPQMFQGTLKAYQIKGMTWLANLYDQGISGILADEMGLGKTVQSIAFLCHIAERYGVWGPFLVISPASTLHNWQQEMQRFVPDFNVVPYWGSPNERKILRQFWEQKDLHTKEASFHVVITSYQLIVSDYKYFNRIKWQYMVLDEAQAIKSATSMRWKLLLGFNCRNRLLLSGTPIQNSMAELWALLHFIMPTLFDSHDEFNEWFSKDIESHAENKTGIDEKQISRLHMILKPFMLRRIKKDVENELSDKIEVMVYCPLTIRQKLLYMALKKKIRIEDLLHLARGGAGATGDGSHVDRNFTSNLMNLVMQFRKVCNHPELFERRNAKSSFIWRCEEYVMPRLIYDEGILSTALPSKRHWVYNRLSIYAKENIQRSLFPITGSQKGSRYVDLNLSNDTGFNFTRLCDLMPQDMEDVTIGGLITLIQNLQQRTALSALIAYRLCWWSHYRPTKHLLLETMTANPLNKLGMSELSILRNFLFTGLTTNESTIYAFGDYTTVNIQETFDHRLIRSKAFKPKIEELDVIEDIKVEVEDDEFDTPRQLNSMQLRMGGHMDDSKLQPEFPHTPRKPQLYFTEPLEMPKFLYGLTPRVQAVQRRLYCNSRAAAYDYARHLKCENSVGYQLITRGLALCKPDCGWSFVNIPDKQTLISDAGKLAVLDNLLKRLKAQGHRVLIYSQMTKMIDLLEEYMWHRKHRYMRLDGSSKISARRDMVADFQTRSDIFVFLLSTRAGGLGINLTAADTVIFYDSDWNPTVDQQAMDRAHRLGQTKQVTVYRLICKGTIEERILQRAREKSEIQRMVISGGNFKPDTLKPKEVVSLLLDDEEIELKYRQKASADYIDSPVLSEKRKRNLNKDMPTTSSGDVGSADNSPTKRFKLEMDDDSSSTSSPNMAALKESFLQMPNEDSDNETLIVDCDNSMHENESPTIFGDYGGIGPIRRRHHPRGTKRGRPRGTTRRGGGNGSISRSKSSPTMSGHPLTTADGEDSSQPQTGHTPGSEGGFPSSALPSIPVKRGPGRPRLKTAGPTHQGTRGAPRTRKPIGPLMVPLGSSPAATPVNRSPVCSPAPSPAQSSPANTTTVHSSSNSSNTSSTFNSQTGIDSTEQ